MILVQQYLLDHTFAQLEIEHGVCVSFDRAGVKFSCNYDMISAKDNDPLAQQCRGLILACHDGRSLTSQAKVNPISGRLDYGDICPGETMIVARSFDRFFNLGQGSAAEINWSDPELRIFQKLDGCLDEHTIISTPNGDKTIKELCDHKKQQKIYSINIETMEVEIDQIVGFSIKNNQNNWYEIELENGTKLKLTGNHKVFIPALGCYRRVEDLLGNEEVKILEK